METNQSKGKVFTRIQKISLAGIAALMGIDTLITALGLAKIPSFIEGNPFFAQFTGDPVQFITVIAVSKVFIVALLILLILVFNRIDRDEGMLNAGNLIGISGVASMGAMMSMLLSLNLFEIIG